MSRSTEICNQLLSLAEQCKIPYGGGVTAQILTNAVREIRRLNEQLAFADNQAEKLEALLVPHVAWDGQPTEIERLRAKLAEAETHLANAMGHINTPIARRKLGIPAGEPWLRAAAEWMEKCEASQERSDEDDEALHLMSGGMASGKGDE